MSIYKSLKWNHSRVARSADGVVLANSPELSLVPQFDAGTTPKSRAVQLLKAAAEVEHQFVVQYLYAFYCGGSAHRELFDIAQEEMGHMLSVQNLLAMLGETPYFGRAGGADPSDEPFLFNLEPYSLPFVARFLVAESSDLATLPADIADHLPAGLTLDHIKHVGAIYTALYWLFQDPNSPLGDWEIPLGCDVSSLAELGHLSDADLADPAGVSGMINKAADWGAATAITGADLNILVIPEDNWGTDKRKLRLAALQTIFTIAGQGEGPVSPGEVLAEKSHAARLHDLYSSLVTAPDPGPSPFPVNPSTTVQVGGADPNTYLISQTDAVARANEFDVVYEKLLLSIALSAVSPADRQAAAGGAIGLMFGINSKAKALVAMPRKDGDATLKAAPPFTFPSGGIPATLGAIKARLTALGG